MLYIVGTPYTVMADNSRQDKIHSRKLVYLRYKKLHDDLIIAYDDESRLSA
jgi:hypothetical protein